MKALKDRIAKLSADESSIDEANRLKNYQHLCSMAEQLHPSRLPRLGAAQLTTIATALVDERVESAAVNKSLVENRIATALKGEVDIAAALKVLKPWPVDEAPFDPRDPMLGKLAESTDVRLEVYRRTFWRKFFAPLLVNGLSNQRKVLHYSQALKRECESEDLLELDGASAATVTETITACDAIEALYLRPVDPRFEAPLLAVQGRAGKSDKSILTCVSSAVFANDVLKGRLVDLLKAMPVIIEFGPTVQGYLEALPTLKHDEASFLKLLDMCKTLTRIHASSASDLFEDFGKKLSSTLLSEWASVRPELSTGSAATAPLMKAVHECFSEASVTFSLEDEVVATVDEVGRCLRQRDITGRATTLSNMLDSGDFDLAVGDGGEWPAKHKALSEVLRDVQGMEFDEGLQAKMFDATAKLLASVATSIKESDPSTMELESAANIFGSMCMMCKSSWMPVSELLRSMVEVKVHQGAAGPGEEDIFEGRPIDELDATMVALGSAAMSTKKKMEGCQAMGKESDGISTLFEAAADLLESAERDLAMFRALRVDRMKEALVASTKALEESAGVGASGSGTWYAEVTGNDDAAWTSLVQKAMRIHHEVDIKKVDKHLGELEQAIFAFDETCKLAECDQEFPEKKAAVGLREKVTIFSVELQLVWYMKSEHEKDSLRNKVRGEIRRLRHLSLKEKLVLPPMLYAKSFAALGGIVPEQRPSTR